MNQPLLRAGQYGTGQRFKLTHEDRFEGTSLNKDHWYVETLASNIHRVGNKGILADGTLAPGKTADHQRWAARYDKHHDVTLRVNDGLHMGVKVTDEKDPTRPEPYEYQDGTLIHPGNQTIYLGWAGTAASKWREEEKRRILDPATPRLTWRYGFFECEVDFNGLWAEGIRNSGWLTALHEEDGTICESDMYDEDPRELECDFWEVEVSERFDGSFNNHLQMKNLGGAAGNSPGGDVDLGEFKINLLDGKRHVIGHLWTPDGHYWYCDGFEVNRDLDRVMQVFARFELTREANSGIVGPNDGRMEDSIIAVPPYLRRDPGLYLTDCYRDLDSAQHSVAIIHRFSVYQHTPVPRQKAAKAPSDTVIEPVTATRAGAKPVITDREFELKKADGILTWNKQPFETKWNVYLDGEYVETVLHPKCTLEHGPGRYSIEGLSPRSVAVEVAA